MNGATTLATYKVNALGQRVEKVAGGVTTRYVYDEQGHLLGEYDSAGKLIQETVWLEDIPVATLRPTGATGSPTPINTYYVLADHLGSPRAVVRPSDSAIMWRWDNTDPFGNNAANENPSGQGTFKYALRFPGQYYDAETSTHYNYFRDYDPSVGRYEQSDPIGLRRWRKHLQLHNSESTQRYFDYLGLRRMWRPDLVGSRVTVPNGNRCGNWREVNAVLTAEAAIVVPRQHATMLRRFTTNCDGQCDRVPARDCVGHSR